MANRAIKYRIYPDADQRVRFEKTFGCCRKIWNLMLEDKNSFYRETGKMLMTTPARYKEAYPYLKEVDSLALANVQLNLESAYKNHFGNGKIGFPKFKSKKHGRKSYTTNNQNGTVALLDKGIRLPKIGVVKARLHRMPDEEWHLKSVTISLEPDGKYYAAVLFEYEEQIPEVNIDPDTAVGLDYKSDGLYMDSDGNSCPGHKYFRESQKKLAKEQRRLRNKTIGSSNYRKQQKKIAKIFRHAANQRKDYLHKKSAEIANQHDIVCVEDLDMRAMSNKAFGNGKATMDNGYGMFLNMLGYKLRERGHLLVKVDKWYPSTQICSCCGTRNKPALKDRIYQCGCGNIIDRDLNAAINIRNEGLRMLREEA